jgi:hypothetical protein
MAGCSGQYAFMACSVGSFALARRDGKGYLHLNYKQPYINKLLQARLNYLESEDDPTLQIVDKIPEEFSDPIHHQALAFEYFSEAYVAFFHGADVFHEQDKALEASYGTSSIFLKQLPPDDRIEAKKNERVVGDLEDKKAQLAQGVKELDELRASKVGHIYDYSGYYRLLNIDPLGTSGKTPENAGLHLG